MTGSNPCPVAYKDIDSVIGVVRQSGIAEPVARMQPLAVIKSQVMIMSTRTSAPNFPILPLDIP